ncbi:ferrochelatase [Candidatus Bandiella euplotis]|uniref:Ferrochelatase n=1 Tax=Candidatus Bandiella euplotis TaxID=1664265 RepID=A0ABZ0UQ41_9RICK|nr:ferrochelatase [Candidatus Bandiella woodruffii]WPX97381.1 Ferrochelatase [Candidatus Bandiella woodruffii]
MIKRKVAIILYNLGGPNGEDDIGPFLFNLFYDKNIINIPNPFRFLVAKFISKSRKKEATKNYNKIGGKSPLLSNTLKQKEALQNKLDKEQYKVFVCMNFWHPMPDEVVDDVKNYNPSGIILLPLYPQFSTTTTGSFLSKWEDARNKAGLVCEQKVVCCYYSQSNFITAYTNILRKFYASAATDGKPFVVFIAHGLPEKIVKNGDPYQWQIENTVKEIVKMADIQGMEYITCYQSRVGPMSWIKPYADEVILKAAQENKIILVIPISFVSEHVETLVELDMEYKELAMHNGARAYHRANTVGDDDIFIEGLKNIVINGVVKDVICPKEYCKCYRQANG